MSDKNNGNASDIKLSIIERNITKSLFQNKLSSNKSFSIINIKHGFYKCIEPIKHCLMKYFHMFLGP